MIKEFENGMTVRELKELIKDWPEERADGTPTEVWLGDAAGYSNAAIEISTLNLDENDCSDVLISHGW
jgi:hypothetical protein